MKLRRLIKNSANEKTTSPGIVIDSGRVVRSNGKSEPAPTALAVGRSTNLDTLKEEAKKDIEAHTNQYLETASDGMSGGSTIRGRNPYGSLMEGFIHTDIDATSGQQMGKNKDTGISRIYRDIYYHDPICGSAIDLMSNMPFSDFSLAGSKDSKVYQKYDESVHNMNIKPLLPILSNEYLTQGLFVSTTIFNEADGIFNGIVPQQIDYVEIQPVPIFGRDPLITLMVGEAYKSLDSSDERMTEYKDLIKPGQDVLKPKPEDVIYIPRRALLRDFRGVSILRRVLSTWLLERALYRGTLDQGMKRQRSITHLTAGDQEWTPTQEEMGQLANMLVSADMDPVGAIFVTRTGVNVSDIRNANDLWKVTDNSDFFTQNKLRSLGISESFISGDASYNSLEQAMSVFIENMRAYREMITYELFYDKTFPRIAQANDYQRRRYGLETASFSDPNQGELFGSDLAPPMALFHERASTMTREERNNLFIPKIQWHKRLRPEADQEYLGLLSTLQENGLPIPLRIWAAAGGLDLDSIMNQKSDDLELRSKVKEWMGKIKPVEGAEGGAGPDAGFDLSSVISAIKQPKTNRFTERLATLDPDSVAPHNIAGGKRHILSKKGEKILNEKIDKKIAAAAASVAAKVNRLEARMEEMARANSSDPKFYTG